MTALFISFMFLPIPALNNVGKATTKEKIPADDTIM